jgi:hypothetical protein
MLKLEFLTDIFVGILQCQKHLEHTLLGILFHGVQTILEWVKNMSIGFSEFFSEFSQPRFSLFIEIFLVLVDYDLGLQVFWYEITYINNITIYLNNTFN